MKAQRRHELQTNTLARTLENIPLYFRFHFGKILFAALVLILLVILLRHRATAARESRLQIANSINEMRRSIAELQQVDLLIPDPAQSVAERRTIVSRIEGTIDQVLRDAEDPQDSAIRAEALVARGDLNWTLANVPPTPQSATQPSLALDRSADDYLAAADQAYREVLTKYPQREMSVLSAMFGLAAIAENRGKWEAAAAQYQMILDRKDLADVFRNLAMVRLQLIPAIQQPVFLGTLTTQPATLPSTQPVPLFDPIAAPTTQP